MDLNPMLLLLMVSTPSPSYMIPWAVFQLEVVIAASALLSAKLRSGLVTRQMPQFGVQGNVQSGVVLQRWPSDGSKQAGTHT